ncbi:substrate-binding periplasmic protein [Vibrio sinaloensis]|uniref:substrate-binding periplasmic protein n=1 Tax=Photobacterium sp. (strain ATCC 43367) TaxID=379097 RepID=UPI0035E74CC8
MISKSYRLVALIFLAFATHVAAHHDRDSTFLHVCGDAIDWPPYTYLEDNDVKGRDIDILNQLLPELGYSFDMTMTSWTRCLKGAAEGDYHIAVSATYKTERVPHYLYTDWYYQVTPYYLYSEERFPEGLSISQVQELEAYKVCGIHGYNYSDFMLSDVHQYTVTMFESINELRQARCDVFLSWQEILQGIESVSGVEHVSDGIVAKPIPNMAKHKFYMLISKQLPIAKELQAELSEGLVRYRELEH